LLAISSFLSQTVFMAEWYLLAILKLSFSNRLYGRVVLVGYNKAFFLKLSFYNRVVLVSYNNCLSPTVFVWQILQAYFLLLLKALSQSAFGAVRY
jgi:hypothetical protein